MDFLEAVKAMKEGKKVRRSNLSGLIWHLEDDLIRDQNGYDFDVSVPEVFLDDWQIVEEKKRLSDNIHYGHSDIRIGEYLAWIPLNDVKEAIKEFLDYSKNTNEEFSKITKKAKEIFGSRLVD